jgi:hypothetical protein
MLRRRDWSQAMVFRVGKNTSNPYVQALAYAETPIIGHVCCRGAAFLLVVLLPRRPSALVPRLWESQSKFPVDRVKRLSLRSIVITNRLVPTYKDLRQNPKGVSWKSTKVGQHRQSAQPTWIPGQNRNRRDGHCRYHANGAEPSVIYRPMWMPMRVQRG